MSSGSSRSQSGTDGEMKLGQLGLYAWGECTSCFHSSAQCATIIHGDSYEKDIHCELLSQFLECALCLIVCAMASSLP